MVVGNVKQPSKIWRVVYSRRRQAESRAASRLFHPPKGEAKQRGFSHSLVSSMDSLFQLPFVPSPSPPLRIFLTLPFFSVGAPRSRLEPHTPWWKVFIFVLAVCVVASEVSGRSETFFLLKSVCGVCVCVCFVCDFSATIYYLHAVVKFWFIYPNNKVTPVDMNDRQVVRLNFFAIEWWGTRYWINCFRAWPRDIFVLLHTCRKRQLIFHVTLATFLNSSALKFNQNIDSISRVHQVETTLQSTADRHISSSGNIRQLRNEFT